MQSLIGFADAHFVRWSYVLIFFDLYCFRILDTLHLPRGWRRFQQNTSRLNNSHRGGWRLCGHILCSASRGLWPPQRSNTSANETTRSACAGRKWSRCPHRDRQVVKAAFLPLLLVRLHRIIGVWLAHRKHVALLCVSSFSLNDRFVKHHSRWLYMVKCRLLGFNWYIYLYALDRHFHEFDEKNAFFEK